MAARSDASDRFGAQSPRSPDNSTRLPEGFVLVADQFAIAQAELENMRRIFVTFDRNCSDTIDVGELQDCLKAIGHHLTLSQVEELMEEVTETPSKTELDFIEFVKLILFWKETARLRLFEMSGSIHEQHIEIASRVPLFVSDAKWRWIWDLVALVVIVYLCCESLLYYIPRIREPNRTVFITIDVLCSVFLAADIFVWFKSASIDSSDPVRPRKFHECLRRYFGVRAVIDVLSAVPWTVLPPEVGVGLVWIRITKMIRLADLWEASGLVVIDSLYVRFHFEVVPIVSGIGYFAILVLTIANIAMMLTDSLRYATAFYYAMYCISGVGYGDLPITVDSDGKKWFTCVAMIASMVVNGYVVGNLVSYFQTSDVESEKKSRLRETGAVCDYFEVPEALANEITQFQDYVLKHKLSMLYADLTRNLPEEMRAQFALYGRMRLLEGHRIFSIAHQGVRVAIAQRVDACVYCPEEFVMMGGEDADESYFIAYGFVDIATRNGLYLCTLKQFDYFGDRALFVPGTKRLLSAKALTYCDLFVLTREAFQGILQRYPMFRRRVRELDMGYRELNATPFSQSICAPQSEQEVKNLVLRDELTTGLIGLMEQQRFEEAATRSDQQAVTSASELQKLESELFLSGAKMLSHDLLPESTPAFALTVEDDGTGDETQPSDEGSLKSVTRKEVLRRKRKLAASQEFDSPQSQKPRSRLASVVIPVRRRSSAGLEVSFRSDHPIPQQKSRRESLFRAPTSPTTPADKWNSFHAFTQSFELPAGHPQPRRESTAQLSEAPSLVSAESLGTTEAGVKLIAQLSKTKITPALDPQTALQQIFHRPFEGIEHSPPQAYLARRRSKAHSASPLAGHLGATELEGQSTDALVDRLEHEMAELNALVTQLFPRGAWEEADSPRGEIPTLARNRLSVVSSQPNSFPREDKRVSFSLAGLGHPTTS